MADDFSDLSIAAPFMTRMREAVWSNFSVNKSVKEGYKISSWVYRAVSIVARNGSSVPWGVFDQKTGEMLPNHHLTKVLQNPAPGAFSSQDLFELILAWEQLAGFAYLYANKPKGEEQQTRELWPISPDRLAPMKASGGGRLIDGYAVNTDNGQAQKKSDKYTVENVIHFKLLDPSDPLQGISPLQSVARTVDIDNAQQDFNKSAMQNRGVVEGMFAFKQPLTKEQHDTVLQKIKEKFGIKNARDPIVVGSEAQYTRFSLTPVEMDFLNTRRFNREEIFGVFGVPVQLANSEASSTYNNFKIALKILWVNTIIPYLMDIADTLNMFFAEELNEGERIGFDLSGVDALNEGASEKAEAAKKYWDMGVPVAVLNDRFKLGLQAFDGWDKPFGGKQQSVVIQASDEARSLEKKHYWSVIPMEQRDVEKEQKRRDTLADGVGLTVFKSLLNAQRKAVFAEMDEEDGDISKAIEESRNEWIDEMRTFSKQVAFEMAGMVVVGQRGDKPNLERRASNDEVIAEYVDDILEKEGVILSDLDGINEFTAKSLTEIISDGLNTGSTVQQMKDAIQDLGIFSEERALRLARTTAGTASSAGQMAAGKASGAQKKTWVTSGSETRDEHVARSGETVDMESRFSKQFSGGDAPRFPLDPQTDVADRVNCRCSMTFS